MIKINKTRNRLLLIPLAGLLFLSIINVQTTSLITDDTTPPQVRWDGVPIIPFVIGRLQLYPKASDEESGIKVIYILVDGRIAATFTSLPKSWVWEQRYLLPRRHTLDLRAFDNAGNSADDIIVLWRFL